MKPKTPQTTARQQPSSSEIDWDKLDEMEPDPAQAEQELNLPSAPHSATPPPSQGAPTAIWEQLTEMGAKPEFKDALMNMATMADPEWAKENYPEMFKK
jgi:hypothetical protein